MHDNTGTAALAARVMNGCDVLHRDIEVLLARAAARAARAAGTNGADDAYETVVDLTFARTHLKAVRNTARTIERQASDGRPHDGSRR